MTHRPHASTSLVVISSTLLATLGCGSDTPSNTTDAATDARIADAPTSDAPRDGASPADGGGPMVQCAPDGPTLVVTQTTGGGPATTLLRLHLRFQGAASGIRLRAVAQRARGAPGAETRAWSVTSLQAPPGFTGAVTPQPGDPFPRVRWTATAPSTTSEAADCALRPWERSGGTIHVEGSTNEGGDFSVDCPLDLGLGGRGAEPLRFACARGVAGWLNNQTGASGITPVTTPVIAVLAEAPLRVHNIGTAPISGFSVTGATVRAHVDARAGLPGAMCPTTDPSDWNLTGGRSVIWRGRSSDEVWSGPVAPGAQEDSSWLYQQNNATVPTGFCVPAMPGDPSRSCPAPANQIVLRGTSSAGPWEWEGDLFNCLIFRP